jgi:hypothetical protein
MKIKPELYAALKSDIESVVKSLGIDVAIADGGKGGLKTMWELFHKTRRDRSYPDTHPAFAQGVWKRILPYDGRNYTCFYADGCNDSHIETALRKIKTELTTNPF